jgi:SOS-response transcriptional repressor LexA
MTVKEACDLWRQYSYEQWVENWLRSGSKSSYLRDSTKNMVKRMKDAMRDAMRDSVSNPNRAAEEAWSLMERLKRLSDGFINNNDVVNETKHKHEKPEIYLECALVAYDLGDLREALALLEVSIGDFPRRSLHKAVSHWLCGCIQWQLPAHSEDAVLSWERSLQTIHEVKKDTFTNDAVTAKRCGEVSLVMEHAIDVATRTGEPPLPPVPGAKHRVTPLVANINAYKAKLKTIPFYGSIPAGNPAQALSYPIGAASIDQLELEDGRFYKIYNVKQEKEIKLNPKLEYFILRADGNSMNIANPVNIDNGDYVLLLRTTMAQNNDIVAGVIVNEDETATLKRYRLEGGRRLLVSESDVDNIRREMAGSDYVEGVVIAILKPQ